MEVFKLLCLCSDPPQDYMVFNDSEGIYTYAYKTEKKEDCLACSQKAKVEELSSGTTLQEFIGIVLEQATGSSFAFKRSGWYIA